MLVIDEIVYGQTEPEEIPPLLIGKAAHSPIYSLSLFPVNDYFSTRILIMLWG
jgi:hypothetical protein